MLTQGGGVPNQGKLADVILEHSLIGNMQGSNTPCLWPNHYARQNSKDYGEAIITEHYKIFQRKLKKHVNTIYITIKILSHGHYSISSPSSISIFFFTPPKITSYKMYPPRQCNNGVDHT